MSQIETYHLRTNDNDVLAGAAQSGIDVATAVEGDQNEAGIVVTYRVNPVRDHRAADIHIPDLTSLQQFSTAFLAEMMKRGLLT